MTEGVAMVRLFYSEYGIENIARRVLTAYDARLYPFPSRT